MKSNFNINTKDIMTWLWSAVDVVVTAIRVLLILGGAIASSLADVTLGAITLSLLFVNTANLESIKGINLAPLVVSLGASGIQLILWQMIENKGWKDAIKSKAFLLAFMAVIFMKFGDDFMDISSTNYLMVSSPLITTFGEQYFRVLKTAVMFIVWVLTGFSELFVVKAIELLKTNNKQVQQKPVQHQVPPYKPGSGDNHPKFQSRSFRLSDDDIIDALRKGKKN